MARYGSCHAFVPGGKMNAWWISKFTNVCMTICLSLIILLLDYSKLTDATSAVTFFGSIFWHPLSLHHSPAPHCLFNLEPSLLCSYNSQGGLGDQLHRLGWCHSLDWVKTFSPLLFISSGYFRLFETEHKWMFRFRMQATSPPAGTVTATDKLFSILWGASERWCQRLRSSEFYSWRFSRRLLPVSWQTCPEKSNSSQGKVASRDRLLARTISKWFVRLSESAENPKKPFCLVRSSQVHLLKYCT